MIALPRLGLMAAADAPIPEGFWAKIRWTLTYATSWMIPLVAIERFADGHYVAGWVLTGCFILNLVVVSRWDQLSALFSERRDKLLTWALIVLGGALLVVGIIHLATDRPPSSSSIQPDLEALKSQLEAERAKNASLEKRLSEQTQTVVSRSSSTETDLVFGPYQPEEVREMILALGNMYDIAVKKLVPAVANLNNVAANAKDKWRSSPNDYIEQLEAAHKAVAEPFRELHKIVFQDNVRFSEELRTTITDPTDTANRLDHAAIDAIETMKVLARAPEGFDVQKIVEKSVLRIQIESMGPLLKVSNGSVERIQKKLTRLRAYKP